MTHEVVYELADVFDLDGGVREVRIRYRCDPCGWSITEGIPTGTTTVVDLRRLRLLGNLHHETGEVGSRLEALADRRWLEYETVHGVV